MERIKGEIMIPMPLIVAGLDLIKTLSSNDEKENEKKVIEVMTKVVEEIPDSIDTRPFWRKKRFWSIVISMLVPIINKVFGWDLDITEVSVVVSPLLLFVATEQWKKR